MFTVKAATVRAPTAMDTLAERVLPEAKIHEMITLTPEDSTSSTSSSGEGFESWRPGDESGDDGH